VLGGLLLGAALLVCLGLLLEAWTNQAFKSMLRRLAEERRRLNEDWAAVSAARRQQDQDPADDDLHGGVAVVDPSDSPALSSAKTASGPISEGISGPSSGSFQRSQTGGKSRLSVAREQGSGRDSLVSTTLPITIYLSDESVHEQVESAVEDLLVATGGHIEYRDDPVLGSWFRRMRARTDQAVHSPLAREAAIVAAHAAESRLVHAQDATITATITATMLQNLGPVLAALHPTKDAVIRAGALLIVKVDWIVAIHQLTPAQQLQLDHQPQLAQSPHDILSALERRTGNSTPSVEGVDGTCGSTTVPRSLNGNPTSLTITSNNGEGSTPLNAADHHVFPETSAGA
jgi:hypothetical protein